MVLVVGVELKKQSPGLSQKQCQPVNPGISNDSSDCGKKGRAICRGSRVSPWRLAFVIET
jgi:hypothetical protein